MRRIVLAAACLAVLGLGARPALAQAQPAPTDEPPICTTTTVVVKKGEVVLSTTSNTKCEDQDRGMSRGIGDVHPGQVLTAPVQILKAIPLGGAPKLGPTHVRGYWRAPRPGARRICHVALMSEAAGGGYAAKPTNCTGALSALASWRFEVDSVALYDASGRMIVRLTGDRDHLTGETADGELVDMQR